MFLIWINLFVQSHMSISGKNDKVFDVVVQWISIDVMYMLKWLKLATYPLLHNPAMSTYLFPVAPYQACPCVRTKFFHVCMVTHCVAVRKT
jgi:hypothetical protein